VLVLSAVSALWLVVAVYFLGDISAHFDQPAWFVVLGADTTDQRGLLPTAER
jgi:hypothetical protein